MKLLQVFARLPLVGVGCSLVSGPAVKVGRSRSQQGLEMPVLGKGRSNTNDDVIVIFDIPALVTLPWDHFSNLEFTIHTSHTPDSWGPLSHFLSFKLSAWLSFLEEPWPEDLRRVTLTGGRELARGRKREGMGWGRSCSEITSISQKWLKLLIISTWLISRILTVPFTFSLCILNLRKKGGQKK